MAKRIIEISVNDEYVVGSGVVIGAEGADESVILRVAFGDAWAGLNIYATFRDSKGESPTVELLMPSMRVLDATVIKYDVVVPPAATAHAGKMSVVFSGFAVSEVSSYEIKTGAEENIKLVYRDAVINTTNAYFRVLPSDFSALDVKDHTEATVLEQVLSEINGFDEKETERRDAEVEREAAETAREVAETKRANAEQERKTAEITRDEKIDKIYEDYESGQLKGEKGDKGDPGSVNVVQTPGDSETDAMSQKTTTDAINELATSQKMLVFGGDFSGVAHEEFKCSIPAGTYDLHIDSIESSDTDATISVILFVSNGATIKSENFERNTPIDKVIEFSSSVDAIRIYASASWDKSQGDTFRVNGLKIIGDTVLNKRITDLNKRITDLEKADLSQKALFENTTNALKGSASGVSSLVIGDVSSTPHTITIQASGGNKVTRYGNNLINVSEDTIRKVTFINSKGEVSSVYNGVTLTLSAGTYTVHAEQIKASNTQIYIYININSANGDYKQSYYCVIGDQTYTTTFTADDGDVLTLYDAGHPNPDADIYKLYLLDYYKYQVETGNTATPCMPYVEPAEYALVNGEAEVDSLYHTTRIVSDTEGVTLEATYNKDINKAYAELVNAIIALGGNV